MEKRRQPNFSSDELEILLASVEQRSKILFGKFGGAVTAAAKDKSWDDVALAVSSVSGIERSSKEVKKKWSSVKSAVKTTVSAAKKERGRTGGGPEGATISEFDNKIVGIMGEVGTVLSFVHSIYYTGKWALNMFKSIVTYEPKQCLLRTVQLKTMPQIGRASIDI